MVSFSNSNNKILWVAGWSATSLHVYFKTLWSGVDFTISIVLSIARERAKAAFVEKAPKISCHPTLLSLNRHMLNCVLFQSHLWNAHSYMPSNIVPQPEQRSECSGEPFLGPFVSTSSMKLVEWMFRAKAFCTRSSSPDGLPQHSQFLRFCFMTLPVIPIAESF